MNRYRNIPKRSIFAAQFGATFFSAWYWTRSTDEMGVLLTALAVAAYSVAGLLIGMEGARFMVPAWRSSRETRSET